MNSNKKLYDVEFAAKITVAAANQREAVHLAFEIIDNPHCYPIFVHETYGYPGPLDMSQLDQPSPTSVRPEPAPAVDEEPIPF
jgi:hypothetical protein